MNLTRFLIFNFGPVIQPSPKVNPSLLVILESKINLLAVGQLGSKVNPSLLVIPGSKVNPSLLAIPDCKINSLAAVLLEGTLFKSCFSWNIPHGTIP